MSTTVSPFEFVPPRADRRRLGEIPVLELFDTRVIPWLVMLLVMGVAFASNIDISGVKRGDVEATLTPQVLIKLGMLGLGALLGVWGLLSTPAMRVLMLSGPGWFLNFLGAWYFVTVPFSIAPKTALASGISYWAAYLLVTFAVAVLGGFRVFLAIAIGLVLYMLGSMALYAVNPAAATFTEVLSEANLVQRFGGLGHPNVLGRTAVYIAILAIAAVSQRWFDWRWLIVIVPLCAAVTLATKSRTPFLAGIVAGAVLCWPLIKRRETFAAVAGLGLLGCLGLLALEASGFFTQLSDRIIAAGTKTGNASEITTLTGRTDIWAHALYHIERSPVVGYGGGTTPILMARHSGNAHNILLEPTLALGVPAGIAVLLVLLWNLGCCWSYQLPVLRATVIFIVVTGVAERVLFGPIPDSMTLAWFAATLWPVTLRARGLTAEPEMSPS